MDLTGQHALRMGEELVRETIEHGPYRDLGWLPHTADAHGLYEKFRFERRSSHLVERLPTG